MYELGLLLTAAVVIGLLSGYFSALRMTMSHGAPTFLTGAILIWGVPGFFFLVTLCFSAQWRGAAAVLALGLGVTISCWIGSKIARWLRRDHFEGAIYGGLLGLLISAMPIRILLLP